MSRVVERTVKYYRTMHMPGLAERIMRLWERDHAIEAAISRRINENGMYAHFFSKVTCKCSVGIVEVCGCVLTNRLKQVLWSLILDLDGVRDIEDRLDVVSPTGLSSICQK